MESSDTQQGAVAMYPSHVVHAFGPLSNYLLGVPDSEELDSYGCLSTSTQARIEKMVLREIEHRIADFQLPMDHPTGLDPNHRWRTVSSMQKAIRYRDCANATYAACTGWDMSPTHILRRLGVIALEDVGAGNLFGIAMCLASLGSSAWRQALGERRLVVWLADQLAQSPKDLTLCELCVLTNYSIDHDKLEMSRRPDTQLVVAMDNRRAPLAHRMAAAWLLSGTHEFYGVTVPRQPRRHARRLIGLMAERGLPRLLLYLAHKAVSRLREDMFVSLLFMHEMLSATASTSVLQPPMIEPVMIGPLLAAAYDMHTREGLQALRVFGERVPTVRVHLEQVQSDQRARLLRLGVFVAEGARLASQLDYIGSIALSDAAHRAELASPGLPPEYHAAFLTVIREHLCQLNALRTLLVQRTRLGDGYPPVADKS